MTIKKWQPFHHIEEFLENLPGVNSKGFDLAMDIKQDTENVYVTMQVPGVDIEHISIEVEGDVLKVSGIREEKKEEKGKDFFRKEIKRGEFARIVELPAQVERENVHAEVKDGVLNIVLPKIKMRKMPKVKIEKK